MPAIIARVSHVEPHPESLQPLDIVTIDGMTNVADRPSPDQPRYRIGDYAVVLGENLILPEWLLRHNDLWNAEKAKGVMAGSKGNRTKARKIAGVVSQVALFKINVTNMVWFDPHDNIHYPVNNVHAIVIGDPSGTDVADWLQISEYHPK